MQIVYSYRSRVNSFESCVGRNERLKTPHLFNNINNKQTTLYDINIAVNLGKKASFLYNYEQTHQSK